MSKAAHLRSLSNKLLVIFEKNITLQILFLSVNQLIILAVIQEIEHQCYGSVTYFSHDICKLDLFVLQKIAVNMCELVGKSENHRTYPAVESY